MQEPIYAHHKQKVNLSRAERIASVMVGARVAYHSIKKGGLIKALAAGYLLYRGFTGRCALYAAMGKEDLPDMDRNINIRTIVHVDKPRNEVYAFWRRLENLPLFMRHLESVETDNAGLSDWKANIPGMPGSIHWTAEVINDVPGEVLGWSSLPGSDIENAGKIEFRDGYNGGTDMYVTISYRAPLGDAGTALATVLTPTFKRIIESDIRNYKSYIEGGIILVAGA